MVQNWSIPLPIRSPCQKFVKHAGSVNAKSSSTEIFTQPLNANCFVQMFEYLSKQKFFVIP